MPAAKVWELDNLVPTGRRLPVSGKQDLRQPIALGTVMLDDVYTDLELHDGASVAEYRDNGTGVGVKYGASSEFKHWVVDGRSPEDPLYAWSLTLGLPMPLT